MSTVMTQRLWSAFRFAQPTVAAGRPDIAGAGTLSGVVQVSGAPAARTVEVYDQATLILAGTVVSDGATGAWTVSGLTTSRPLRVIYRGTGAERDVTIQGVYAT
jgi:hypothetical protein